MELSTCTVSTSTLTVVSTNGKSTKIVDGNLVEVIPSFENSLVYEGITLSLIYGSRRTVSSFMGEATCTFSRRLKQPLIRKILL